MNSSFYVPLVSGVLIFFIGCTFLYFYFRNLQEETRRIWDELNQKTRLRLDKLPLFIEIIRRSQKAPEALIKAIIQAREKIWPLEEPSTQKVQLELALSSQLHELWTQLEQEDALRNDVNFMALKKEIIDIGQEIDAFADSYNQKIYRYNQKIRFVLWKPFAMLFGFRHMPIFEFEV